jgi:hypothetical protein
VDQVVQGVSEALGHKWLTGNRLRPSGLVWSGDDTLCGRRGDSLLLVEKLLSGGNIKMTKHRAWQMPSWRAFVASQVMLLERLGDREEILLCECFNNVD